MSLNKQILIGNLGGDPETIHFDNGGQVTKFSLATTERWTDKSTGEKKQNTDWHNIVCNGKLADIAKTYLKKGSKIYLEGRTKHRMYEQDGIKKYITEVMVRDLVFLSSVQQSTPLDNLHNKNNVNQSQSEEDDDLPF